MDCILRFWSNETGVVCSKYFDSKFLLLPNSKNLFEKLLESIKLLDLSTLLSSQWMVLMLIGMYWNWCTPTKEKWCIRISSALEIAVSKLFMGYFKVVLNCRIGSWQRYFVQCTIFLKSHLLGLTNIWNFVNLILLSYRKSIYFRKHKLNDFILFDTSKQIFFWWTVCTISNNQLIAKM